MKRNQKPSVPNVFDELNYTDKIFDNRDVLASSFIPTEFPHRKYEIEEIASILRPALYEGRPSNILIYGQTGTGKTAITKFICNQLKEKALTNGKKINSAYLNCKQINTPYGVLTNIGKAYSRDWEKSIPSAGWRIEKVYSALKEKADEVAGLTLVVLDEIDALVSKSGDEILYHLTGINAVLKNSKITIIGISNDTKFTTWLDPRVKSRLGEESLIFSPYNAIQIEDILKQRSQVAFKKNSIDPLVLSFCSSRAAQEHGDARKALDLLRISAEMAEREGEELVTIEFVKKAQNVMEQDLIRNLVSTLPIQHKATFASIILNKGNKKKVQQTTGEVYGTYSLVCEEFNLDRLTQRRIGHIIAELDMQGLITAKIISLGRQGRTKYINLAIGNRQINSILEDDSFLSEIVFNMKKTGFKGSVQVRLL